jgi:hypothetical protein
MNTLEQPKPSVVLRALGLFLKVRALLAASMPPWGDLWKKVNR